MASPIDIAWAVLKALPEQQMHYQDDRPFNLRNRLWRSRGRRLGTIHPAIAGLLERHAANRAGIPKELFERAKKEHPWAFRSPEGYLVPSKTSMDMFGESQNHQMPPPIQNIPGPANWRYPTRNRDETQDEFKRRQKQVRALYLDPEYEDIYRLNEQLAAQEAAAAQEARLEGAPDFDAAVWQGFASRE